MAETDADDMPDAGVLREQIDDTQFLMTEARRRMRAAIEALGVGEKGAVKTVAAEHKEMSALMRVAIETEGKLNEWIAKHSPDDTPKPDIIDIDAARRDIGCRLDRLRACCRPE